MYEVIFYEDRKGNSPVWDHIQALQAKKGKSARIEVEKIFDYIDVLSERGTYAGKPYVDHLDGDIWELRPLRDRILFAGWDGNKFVLLHLFFKDTQRTPKREIEKAKKELADFRKMMSEKEKS